MEQGENSLINKFLFCIHSFSTGHLRLCRLLKKVKGNKKELELGIYTKPRIFYINDVIYVAITDLQSQQVYLFRSTAAPVAGFPVEGSGLADMADTDGDRNPELVVPYRDRQIRMYNLRR